MRTAGILPSYFIKPTFLGELKQTILLFDKAGIPLLNGIYDVLKKPTSREDLRYLINEFELLESKGYIFDAWLKSGTPLDPDIDFKAFSMAKGFFKAQADKAELLNIELNSPGAEIAYIYETKKIFK